MFKFKQQQADKLKAFEKAKEIYEKYRLKAGFDTVELAKELGFKVVKGNFNAELLGGNKNDIVSGGIDYNNKIIYVNDGDSIGRRRFTIAHELGHWFLHKPELNDDIRIMVDFRNGKSNSKEAEANYFASELLMNYNEIYRFCNENKGKKFFSISDFMHYFKVSEQAAKIKIRSLNIDI